MGYATDSAGFQLAAASSLMSPSPYLLNLGVLYLTFRGWREGLFSTLPRIFAIICIPGL